MVWVDAHCHLQERYRDDDAGIAALFARAREAGTAALVVVGTDAQTSEEAIDLAAEAAAGRFGAEAPLVRAVVGLHPHEATSGTAPIKALLDRHSPHVAGVGEAGLDYYYEHSPRAVQRVAFAEQVGFAHAYNLPLVIHARDAWDDLFDVLRSEGVPTETVLHCFTGGPEEAERCLAAGMTVSFSGIASFPKAPEVREAAALVPLERLLVETDSPFLAPVPHRGKKNEPSFVHLVGAVIAGAKGCTPDEVARASTANAERIFKFTLDPSV